MVTNPPPGWQAGPSDPWPPYPLSTGPQAPAKEKNTLGLIALIVGVIGLIFACIPGALIVGWVLLPIAFILGIVGLLQSGRAKGTAIAAVVLSVVGTVIGVSVFIVVVRDSFSNALKNSDLSPPAPTAVNGGGDTNQSGSPGSRENPFPIGETVSNRDWQVTLGAPREGWAEIAATNQFNQPPKLGMEYWIVPVTATYNGDKTGSPSFGITVKFVGTDNRTYDDSCGVIPDPISDVGDLYRGGQAKGNTCVTIPAGTRGLWTLSTGFVGQPVFFLAK